MANWRREILKYRFVTWLFCNYMDDEG